MKIYTKKNVFESSLDRIRWVFKEMKGNIVVGFSGGKDSTVVLELALIVMRELKEQGKLPQDYKLKVMWLDQEIEWTETVNYCKRVMARDEVDFYRMQLPMRMSNNASFHQSFINIWDETLDNSKLCQVRDDKKLKEFNINSLEDLAEDDYWYDGETIIWDVLYDCTHEQERFVAMQCTGLQDIDGNDIFENDIVSFMEDGDISVGITPLNIKGIIEYLEGSYVVSQENTNNKYIDLMSYTINPSFKIIGNKFDKEEK